MKNRALGLVVAVATLIGAGPAFAQKDLSMGELQKIVRQVVDKISPSVVGLRMTNGSSGSGVMVNSEGLIMTAAHVTHPPGKAVQISVQFPDGRSAKVEKRGAFYAQDAAFAHITDEAKNWPFVKCAKQNPRVGDWVIALGHTAGFDPARTPPVRVGQVLAVPKGNGVGYIVTDCSMAGGDSGGPLFNLQGEIIGIHSSIGRSLKQNLHVPIQVYLRDWDRMVSGEEWGQGGTAAVLGVGIAPKGDDDKPGAVIERIQPESPAANAGLVPGDRILKFNGKDVADGDALIGILRGIRPGQKVEVEVERPVEDDENPAAEDDPDAEQKYEKLTLEVEFPGKSKTSVDSLGELVPIQFDFGNIRRPGSRDGRNSMDIGLFTRGAGTGLGVTQVANGSPAAKAGIRRGDFIVRVDGVPISTPGALTERFEAAKPGDTIVVTVRRGGQDVDLEIKLPKPKRPDGGVAERLPDDPNALRDLLAKMRDGTIDLEEARRLFEGRLPNLKVAPGYKKIAPRGEGPVLDQFKPVASTARGSVVEMIDGYRSVGLGTAVTESIVLTKASELKNHDKLRVELPNGVWVDANLLKSFKDWDLALVEIKTDQKLIPISFNTKDEVATVGTFVTAFDNGLDALGWGVIGVASRSLAPKSRPFLGVQVKEGEGGVTVEKVIEGSAAEKSGIKVGDLIRKAKDQAIKDPNSLTSLIRSCKAGEDILIDILRDGKDESIVAKLGEMTAKEVTAPPVSNTSRMGTKLSEHRYGYPSAMQHDVPMAPNQMGGPLVSLEGEVLGINIARAGRTKTFAIPSRAIVELLEKEGF